MEFFNTLNTIRIDSNLSQKLERLWTFNAELLGRQHIDWNHDAVIEPVGNPSYAKQCQIVHGSQVERRRNLGTVEGRIIFLHALAHIEYSAIDLALDSAYRYRRLPAQFYEDWLNVAADEARHFLMLQGLLKELGADYGSLTVHTGIHDAMARSSGSLRQRMAATHRHLEANGLDAHPELARKIGEFKDPFARKICAALQVIFDDEIVHVHAGDFWFRYACGLDKVDTAIFAQDVTQAIPGVKLQKKNLNIPARKKAGFTDAELEKLTTP